MIACRTRRSQPRTVPTDGRPALALIAGAAFAALAPAAPLAAPLAARASSADEAGAPADKRGYTLFHPTPDHLLRPLSADRPDKTDSAYTVDAGHWQVEMDYVNFVQDRPGAGQRFRGFEIAPMNLKVGLWNPVDLQLAVLPYRQWSLSDPRAAARRRGHGFGDVSPRLKLNAVGNDGGPFALALMPFVKVPTHQDALGNRSIEGGLKVPFSLEVPGWDVSFQTEADWIRNESGPGYHAELIDSVSVGHPLVGRLSLYAEFFSNVRTESSAGWIGTLDTWLTYSVSRSLRLEAGVYIGVTAAAEDWHPFIGMTYRY